MTSDARQGRMVPVMVRLNPGQVAMLDLIADSENGERRWWRAMPVNVPVGLIEDICYAWDRWEAAAHPLEQAGPLTELADRVSDLRSYHPDWDAETGTMPWDRDEG